MSNECNDQIEGESDFDKISMLNAKINNYSTKIEYLYDQIDKIEEKIKTLDK